LLPSFLALFASSLSYRFLFSSCSSRLSPRSSLLFPPSFFFFSLSLSPPSPFSPPFSPPFFLSPFFFLSFFLSFSLP
ncbi:hypothetical protein ACXWRW_12130, partial [Streptococcus pyogenes]